MSVIKKCIVCSNVFQAEIYYGHARNTCSDKCRYKFISNKFKKRIDRTCPQCGNKFSTCSSSKKVLCSPNCRKTYMGNLFSGRGNPNWIETKELRPATKRSLRKRIRVRDKVCQDCGSTKNLHVHHIDGNYKNNKEDNLILLCKVCHAKRHLANGEISVVTLVLANRTYPQRKPRKCLVCGIEFMPKRKLGICCSPQCGRIQSGISRRTNHF